MCTRDSTSAYVNFQWSMERLNTFFRLTQSLDLDAKEIRSLKRDFHDSILTDSLSSLRDQLVSEDPQLEKNQAELTNRILLLQKDMGESHLQTILSRYYDLRNELVIVQLVTLTEIYIADLLTLLFGVNNELLLFLESDNDLMKYEEILKYNSIAEIKGVIVEKRVQQIMRKSIVNMLKFVQRCCKGPKMSAEEFEEIDRIWDSRNLIVHQACKADEYYAEKYGLNKGDRLTISQQNIENSLDILQTVFSRIDQRAFSEFFHEKGL